MTQHLLRKINDSAELTLEKKAERIKSDQIAKESAELHAIEQQLKKHNQDIFM